MKSTSYHFSTIQDLERELNTIQKSEFNPTLAIVFSSIDCDLEQIPILFNKFNLEVIGCSSSGEICDEGVYNSGISVLLMDVNQEYFQVCVTNSIDEDFGQAGVSIGEKGKSFCDTPSFLMFFNMMAEAESLIKGITSVVPDKPNIFGGMAGDDFNMVQTFTFTNKGVFQEAIVTLIFNQEKVEVKGLSLCGWEPIGTTNTITKAEGSIVYEINDKPALEVFENYFGSFHENSYDEDVVAVGVAQYPLQIIRGENTVLRAALTVNEEDKSIIMAGPVMTGDIFKFSVAPGFEIIEDTISGFQKYQEERNNADALILVSCVARHMSLGPMIEEEIKGIQNIWEKPMVGFFSYGEVGLSEKGDCLFYNDTCSLILIREC